MAFLLALILTASLSAAEAPFVVIVHRSNPATSISRAELSAVYMKRLRSWHGGAEIVPVEQPLRSRIREQFSRAVHGKSVAYVNRYWQRLIFAGRAVPPPELRNSDAVVQFVRAHRGAIGYVDRRTPLGDDVQAIAVTP